LKKNKIALPYRLQIKIFKFHSYKINLNNWLNSKFLLKKVPLKLFNKLKILKIQIWINFNKKIKFFVKLYRICSFYIKILLNSNKKMIKWILFWDNIKDHKKRSRWWKNILIQFLPKIRDTSNNTSNWKIQWKMKKNGCN
jgi:hypothetical protein